MPLRSSRFMPLRRWRRSRSNRAARRAQGYAAASVYRLDLGAADGRDCDQLVLDSRDQTERSVQSDPWAIDLHPRDAAARGPACRGHNADRHRRAMLGIFTGAMVIAGAFTFLPGRIMHAVAFGN